jgi:ribosomal 30S subunit maturation factor RimM
MKLVETWIPVATVVGAHGLHGILKVLPWVANPDWLDWFEARTARKKDTKAAALTIQLQPEHPEHAEASVFSLSRWEVVAPKKLRLTLPEITTRVAAERWRQATLRVPAKAIADLSSPQSYNPWLMVGYQAILKNSSAPIGFVDDIASSGDMLFLQLAAPADSPKAGRTWLIPLSPHIVPSVDVASQTIWLDHLEGFFDD